MQIDLMSISGHKIYGPKGVGALYVRRRPRVRLLPLIDGGGQERGLRSGTLPTPLCVGLGRAAAIAGAEMAEEAARLRQLRDRLQTSLVRRVAGLRLNGDAERRLPGSLNLSFPGIPAPEADRGLPEHRDLDRVGLHLGERSSRPMCCARWVSRTRCQCGDPPRPRPLHHRGRGRFRGRRAAAAASRLAAESRMAGQDGKPI